MNADAFRHFYDYHFWSNRRTWDEYIARISDEQFTQPLGYSHGSIRDQILHLIEVDNAWFGDITGNGIPHEDDPTQSADREALAGFRDQVEQMMRGYLATLRDDMLMTKPLQSEDAGLFLWQVLLHVVNHGIDHRAQILRQLNDLGVQTEWQDYIFYCYGTQTLAS